MVDVIYSATSVMKKDFGKKSVLKALNDIYIIKEDPMTEYKGTLVIPDAYEFWAKKYPCTGRVVSAGNKTKYGLAIGTRVVYGRLGVQRYEHDGQEYCDVRESDLHAVIG